MATPILTYFLYDDCQTIATRLILQFGNVKYQERQITKEQWNDDFQHKVPGGHMPFVEYDGQFYSQNFAMQQIAAQRSEFLMPNISSLQARASMICSTLDDGRVHSGIYADTETMDEYDRCVRMNESAAKFFGSQLAHVEKMLEAFGAQKTNWTLGDVVTYVDCVIAAAYKTVTKVECCEETGKKYPLIAKIAKQILSHPATIDLHRLRNSKVVTTYFGGMTGRVHCVRHMLRILDVKFEDKVFSWEESKAYLQEKSLSGKVPTLEVDGIQFTDTRAIMKFLAKMANMDVDTIEDEAHAWQIVHACDEYEQVLWHTWGTDCSPEEQKKSRQDALRCHVPKVLAALDRLVGLKQDIQGHVLANKLTWIDFMIFGMYDWLSCRFMDLIIDDLEKQVPHILKVVKMISSIPCCQAVERTWEGHTSKLVYFDIPGLGEACRLMFHLAGAKFEDVRLSREDWFGTYKAKSPTGHCPYLEIGDTIICEQVAIIRHAAESGDFIPYRHKARLAADSYHSQWLTTIQSIKKEVSYDDPERPAKKKELATAKLVPALEKFASYVKKTQSVEGYLVENRLTWIDVYVAAEAKNLLGEEWLTAEQLKAIEPVQKTMALVYGLAETQSFLQAEKQRDKAAVAA